MNTLQDTISTLTPGGRFLAEWVMEQSREMFRELGKVSPGMFAITEVSQDVKCEDVEVLDPDTKPIVWAKLRRWREQYPVVAWISEVWMVESKTKDADLSIMPRNNPNRTESIMLQLWDGPRSVTFMSRIHRQPTRLGDWTILFDSNFPKQGMSELGGAMMEGRTYRGAGN